MTLPDRDFDLLTATLSVSGDVIVRLHDDAAVTFTECREPYCAASVASARLTPDAARDLARSLFALVGDPS